MAKVKTGVLGTGAFRQAHMQVADLPWDDIEARVGVTFDTQARLEIFRCFWAYHAHLSVEQGRVTPDEVEALRRTIVTSAQNLIDVLEHFRSPNGTAVSDADEALYSALALSSAHPDFDLTTLLRQIAPFCQELLSGLHDQWVDLAITRVNPEVAALAAFFVEALSGAQCKAARTSPGFQVPPNALEYHRWGVPIGPTPPLTAVLAEAVLDRPVTTSQVERAFKVLKSQKP